MKIKPTDFNSLRPLALPAPEGIHPPYKPKIPQNFNFCGAIGKSRNFFEMIEKIAQNAQNDFTVLITGETGVGKELAARMLHENSARKEFNFIVVECSGLDSELARSELFGHSKGAFTGANIETQGYVGSAKNGTLFLDEIGDMPLLIQSKILRFLETKARIKVGESKEEFIDTRIILATNQNLPDLVRRSRFRKDLYYRMKTVTINVPPLRERKEDIPLLIEYFLKNLGCPQIKIEKNTLIALQRYNWPGNIRELKNLIISLVSKEVDIITINHLNGFEEPESLRTYDSSKALVPLVPPPSPLQMEEGILAKLIAPGESVDLLTVGKRAQALVEKELIVKTLERTGWNRKKTAEILYISYKALLYKMTNYGLIPKQ
jgi:DNA-binding NtrC family response regulator